MDELKNTLNALCEQVPLAVGKELHKIYLYGSYARGDYNQDSDIDVMIIIDNEDIDKYADRIDEITGNICLEQEVLLSTQIASKKDWEKKQSYIPYYNNILREGKIIYDSEK